MITACKIATELNRARKRRRWTQPEASASRADQSNGDDDVIFMGFQADDVEPDQLALYTARRKTVVSVYIT